MALRKAKTLYRVLAILCAIGLSEIIAYKTNILMKKNFSSIEASLRYIFNAEKIMYFKILTRFWTIHNRNVSQFVFNSVVSVDLDQTVFK